MTCPANPPPPPGFRVWKGPVSTPLTQWAIQLRDGMRDVPYGQTWMFGDGTVARKDHHTWTYRNGQLVTGICIPGITLYQPVAGGVLATQDPASLDVNAAPGPDVGAYGGEPHDETDWGLVAVGTTAIFALAFGLAAVIHRKPGV